MPNPRNHLSWHREDESPVITFEITNVGNSHAYILRATYDYELSKDLPESFGTHGVVNDVPGLLGPTAKSGPIVIYDLPSMKAQDHRTITAGNLFLFLRTAVVYRDVFGNVHEIKVTGRYGRAIDSDGESVLGFRFPDANVPPSQWWTTDEFRERRRLNFLESIDPNTPPKD
jgi:hypothetical protein